MRLISQNKEINIPYERMAVETDLIDGAWGIIAYNTANNDRDSAWEMAVYGTYEKTMKVMEMLRNASNPFTCSDGKPHEIRVFEFPKNEDVT